MRRLVLIFPELAPIHLGKDVGRVPLCLKEFADFKPEIWGGRVAELAQVEEGEIELKPFENDSLVGRRFEACLRLLSHSKNIDCLMLFHFKLETLFFALLYRMLNSRGLVYLKSDANKASEKLLRSPFKKCAVWLMIRFSRCVSFETSQVYALFSQAFPQFRSRFALLPNEIEFSPETDWRLKENVMLTAGRLSLGTKGTLKLLHILCEIRERLHGWQVLLVGDYEDIRGEVEDFFAVHPEMSGIIRFTGHIADRSALYELYQRSRIYLVPSTTESFGIAMLEAAFFGNVLVGYDVGGMMDLTDSGRFGKVVPVADETAFASALKTYLSKEADLDRDGRATQKFVQAKFMWGSNIPEVVTRLSE